MDALETALYHLVYRAVTDAVAPVVRAAVRAELEGLDRRLALGPTLTRAAAARELGWSVSKLDSWRRAGRIPYEKVGRSVRFAREDIDRIRRDGRVAARRTR